MKKIEIISLKKASSMLGMSKKDLTKLLREKKIITASGAVIPENANGMVAELCTHISPNILVTKLFVTTKGMLTLIEEVYNG